MKGSADEYRTPRPFFDGLDAELHFTIDVAATVQNTLCTDYLCPAENALKRDWGPSGGVAWCNPPYSPGNIPRFLQAASEQRRRGVTSVVLVPLDPGQSWTQHVFGQAAEIRAIVGRLRFDEVDGTPAPSCATKPSALIVYRPCYFGPTLCSYIERRVIEAVGSAVDRGEEGSC